ncbi:MAG: lipocalin family protein [Woeseiaceae bacterium]
MRRILVSLTASIMMSGCASEPPELATVDYVDLERFMGDWYVIANIPTFLEKGAHNAVENYALNDDGSIATTFTFRKDGFDGKEKEHNPKGFVTDTETNAVWGMRFVWPIKADYRVIYLDEDYSVTIIGRNKRDYVWIMAREPQISAEVYNEAVDVVVAAGYDIGKLRRIPQQW